MTKSPCIGCEFELADKNNPTCRECDRRVEYVESIGGMTHSVPEISITLKEVAKMAKIGVEETNGIEIEGQKPAIKEQTPVIPATCCDSAQARREAGIQETGEKKCIINGCGRKVVARGFCDTHFTAWRQGRVIHPTEGVYKKIRFSKARAAKNKPAQGKKAPVKKTKSPESIPGKLEYTRLDGGLTIRLDNCPRIKSQVDFLADKYLVNSEHAIIGLLGEALAGRRERSDHE